MPPVDMGLPSSSINTWNCLLSSVTACNFSIVVSTGICHSEKYQPAISSIACRLAGCTILKSITPIISLFYFLQCSYRRSIGNDLFYFTGRQGNHCYQGGSRLLLYH